VEDPMPESRDTLLSGSNALYLEELLRRFAGDPGSVPPSWRAYFEGPGRELAQGHPPAPRPQVAPRSIFAGAATNGAAAGRLQVPSLAAQSHVVQLIDAYRTYGHLAAQLDPLGLRKVTRSKELDPAYWGFTEADLDRHYATNALHGPATMTLRELVGFLEDTYARTIGAQFMHISDEDVQHWLTERCERTRNHLEPDRELQRYIFEQLSAAEAFEQFIHVKYRGAKRFSLEGAESLIPLLAVLLEEAAARGVSEVVLGMPHRGRLNVLTHFFGKAYRSVFTEFEDVAHLEMIGRGDVKYHLGYSVDRTTRLGHQVHLSLAFNPSHLETIDPVVVGRVRAKQDRYGDRQRTRCLPITLHGDSAFIGQGVVQETLNLMSLPGYTVGGTIHVVVNNQIGFTTLPSEYRSSHYATDIAMMVEVPIFHVNGEDPEAVAQVVKIAAEFRQAFHRDVIIDLYCFRRHGHNEADEPRFTQPVMYDAIDRHPPVGKVYADLCVARGVLTAEEVRAISSDVTARLETHLEQAKSATARAEDGTGAFGGVWQGYLGGADADSPEVPTAIDPARLDHLVRCLGTTPADFHLHSRHARLLERRRQVLDGAGLAPPPPRTTAPGGVAPPPPRTLDWGMGELLAYGSLCLDGHPVRLSGQDSCRGTFSHRHAVLYDAEDGHAYTALSNLGPDQARFEVYNSSLSEAAVLGFELGYSLDAPDALVIWEAQFGDFANGAQVVIDQFVSACEDKWQRISGVVLFLPHGFEGQGPEHSSARLERYLQLSAEDNLQVVVPTTPAQIFHVLRRQVLRGYRKPLVVMSPKSLLRHKDAVSTRDELTQGSFRRLLPDPKVAPGEARRVVLCSGKVYYDLVDRRTAVGDTATAIHRLEQLYPFPEVALREAIASSPKLEELIWCQEEPANNGAQSWLYPRLTGLLAGGPALRWVARAESASPATGSKKAHDHEQAELMERVFP
jgi:2-oxoglutarate dehydrogenase E1 component